MCFQGFACIYLSEYLLRLLFFCAVLIFSSSPFFCGGLCGRLSPFVRCGATCRCCCFYTCDIICVLIWAFGALKRTSLDFSDLNCRMEDEIRKDKLSCGIEWNWAFYKQKYPVNRSEENQLFACIFLFIFIYFLEFSGDSTGYLKIRISVLISISILKYSFCIKFDLI